MHFGFIHMHAYFVFELHNMIVIASCHGIYSTGK